MKKIEDLAEQKEQNAREFRHVRAASKSLLFRLCRKHDIIYCLPGDKFKEKVGLTFEVCRPLTHKIFYYGPTLWKYVYF